IWVYIGTYTQKEPHVSGKAEGIYIYEMNTSTGALTYVATSPPTVNPSYVALHPNGKWLFAANETGDGKLSAFYIDREKKQLVFINSVSSHGSASCYVSIDHTGKYVMTANYSSGTVALYPLDENGRLREATSVHKHEGKGPDSRQEGPHAHMIVPAKISPYVYAVDLGIDQVMIYALDPSRSTLTLTGSYKTKAGAGPRHIALHHNNRWAYIINELNGTIEACTVDARTALLSRFQDISTLPVGESRKAGCADIHITPSGKYLYATNRGEINTIAMYSIGEDGKLTLLGHQPVKGRTPRSFAIDPTGSFLLVANQDSDNVVTFKIDPKTGKLIDTGIESKIPTPVCIKFE
ncbi:MAG: lactonase family protein, partial [Bacteroidales bacterium]|nr:lactonase family protein [Bacteroidales bacterium]